LGAVCAGQPCAVRQPWAPRRPPPPGIAGAGQPLAVGCPWT